MISAGFSGSGYKSPEIAINVAERFGIDLAGHRSVTATAALLESADLIVTMSPEQRRLLERRGVSAALPVAILGDFDPDYGEPRAIGDPWNGDEARFRECYRRIERCVRELALVIARNA